MPLGASADYIEAETAAAPDAIAALTEATVPPGSHLLLTVFLGDQRPTLQTRTDSPAAPSAPRWLRPEHEKPRWFDRVTTQEIAAE